jgi:mono/diheme cytochrome c family protein
MFDSLRPEVAQKTQDCRDPDKGNAMKTAIILTTLAVISGLAACATAPEYEGRAIYTENCVTCHGPTGRGDGPLAAELDRPVPDLTLIARRNGGAFPMAKVLSTIDGYTRAREGHIVMPEFGKFLQAGPLVSYDSGDGVATPTPSRLIAIAEYLQSIQR